MRDAAKPQLPRLANLLHSKPLARDPRLSTPLGGSWVVISGVRVSIIITHIVITHIKGLISPRITTHEAPSNPVSGQVQEKDQEKEPKEKEPKDKEKPQTLNPKP